MKRYDCIVIDFSLKQRSASNIAAKFLFLFHNEAPELLNE